MSTESIVIAIGTYSQEESLHQGGIFSYEIDFDLKSANLLAETKIPSEAGYLVFNSKNRILYAVDERRAIGPNTNSSEVSVYSLKYENNKFVNQSSIKTFGANPTFLALDVDRNLLFSANHGGLGVHAQKITGNFESGWKTEFIFDDSSVVTYKLSPEGDLIEVSDVKVLTGNGIVPNKSPQVAGFAQTGPHAHCAVLSPGGKFVLVADKGTDQLIVYEAGEILKEINSLKFPDVTGPRHLVFSETGELIYLTLEFSSEVATLIFDNKTGNLQLINRISTVSPTFKELNEPAEIRIHRTNKFLYVNNRGEDSIAWFHIDEDGLPTRKGDFKLAKSIHPGLAARSFVITPDGKHLIFADRPANLIRVFSIDINDGSLLEIFVFNVLNPAYVEILEGKE